MTRSRNSRRGRHGRGWCWCRNCRAESPSVRHRARCERKWTDPETELASHGYAPDGTPPPEPNPMHLAQGGDEWDPWELAFYFKRPEFDWRIKLHGGEEEFRLYEIWSGVWSEVDTKTNGMSVRRTA